MLLNRRPATLEAADGRKRTSRAGPSRRAGPGARVLSKTVGRKPAPGLRASRFATHLEPRPEADRTEVARRREKEAQWGSPLAVLFWSQDLKNRDEIEEAGGLICSKMAQS